MIYPRQPSNQEYCIPGFWKLLSFFFEPDRFQQWRREIFPDPTDPEKGADGPQNMIYLSKSAHDLWARGAFALRPISQSDDLKELTIQFYWQPRPPHRPIAASILLTSWNAPFPLKI
jgi:hypothetical protein